MSAGQWSCVASSHVPGLRRPHGGAGAPRRRPRPRRGGRPASSFVGGESGVGKTRLLREFEPRARAGSARVLLGQCLELGGAQIPYAPIVSALRPLARGLADEGRTLPQATRNALADLMPELGGTGTHGRRGAGARQGRLFEALLSLLERLGRDAPGAALDRGPALGRRHHARLHHLPRAQRARGAALPRRHVPLRRAAPPPSAAPADRRARARRRRRPARPGALRPRGARRAARRHPPASRRSTSWPSSSSAARRATRSTPRSCSRRARAATPGCCPRRCATC